MIIKIDVPEQYSHIDIKEIHVIGNSDVGKFFEWYNVDETFDNQALLGDFGSDGAIKPAIIMDAAMKYRANLVVIGDGSIALHRVNEKKRPGRDYVGVGVGVVVRNDVGEVVMTYRSGTSNNRSGLWCLPGGTDEMDGLELTVSNELDQEIGIKAKIVDWIDVAMDKPEGQYWISFACVADIVGGEVRNGEPYKFAEVKAFPMDKLPSPMSKLTKRVLDRYNLYIKGELQPLEIGLIEE